MGSPVEVSVDGPVPEGGVVLTRTYPIPVPEDVAVAFVFYDDATGEWWAVPSTLSADRRSVTATVNHLSIWNTIVQGAQDAMQGFTEGLSRAGTVIRDGADAVSSGLETFNTAVQDAFVAAAEEAYYWVGKVFDVRVDAPVCDGEIPEWADDAVFIESDRSNPVLWCAGHDGARPDLLVVKARVNRGYGSFVEIAAPPSWTYNSTFDQSLFDTALDAITELDQTLAQSVVEVAGDGLMVGPGQEISLGFSQDAVRTVPNGVPLVTLGLPGVAGFLATSIAQAVTQSSEMLLEGNLAALIAVAMCVRELADVDDAAGIASSAITCISGFGEAIARHVAVGILAVRPGTSATVAGQTAGKILGRFTVWLALIGPVFTIMDYTGDSMLPESARTLTVFVKVADAPTEVVILNPFAPDGTLKPEYTIDDQSALPPVECFEASVSAVTGGTHWCGSTADSTHSCWASPRYPGQVLCMTVPWQDELLLRRAVGLSGTAAPSEPQPLGIELEDGTLWWLRHGGSWGGRADAYIGVYGCGSAACDYSRTGIDLAVVADREPAIDTSTNPWTVLVGELSATNDALPPPERLEVTRAWFIASDFE